MITVRPSEERGRFQIDWLDSKHSFSFGEYRDPQHMGFGPLRVINEDVVSPQGGFRPHSHQNMEIISYVLDGALEHKDSMGNGSVIRPGDVQRMSAGTGVTHSEFNPSEEDSVKFLQIWIIPEADGLDPSYEQKNFSVADKQGGLRLIASRDGRDGSVTVHQDADLYASVLPAGESASLTIASDRRVWIQVARGAVSVNGVDLGEGAGAAVTDETELTIKAVEDAEFLVFDLL